MWGWSSRCPWQHKRLLRAHTAAKVNTARSIATPVSVKTISELITFVSYSNAHQCIITQEKANDIAAPNMKDKWILFDAL